MPELRNMPEFVSVDEFAACIGVHRDLVYRQIKEGALPGFRRIGRCLRGHRDTLLDWFRGNGAQPGGSP